MVLATGLAFVMLGFGGFGGLINMGYGMNSFCAAVEHAALDQQTVDAHAISHVASTHNVMAGLVPAIHVLVAARKTWMPGPRPGMTA